MDILLKDDGDLYISEEGDILLKDLVSQKIRIKVLWFRDEWRWDKDIGLPYYENLLVKNPDIKAFEDALKEAIFEIDEVTNVDVYIDINEQTREANIQYTVETDYETITEEMNLCLMKNME